MCAATLGVLCVINSPSSASVSVHLIEDDGDEEVEDEEAAEEDADLQHAQQSVHTPHSEKSAAT